LGQLFFWVSKRLKNEEGNEVFGIALGYEDSKDWVDWDVEEQDIFLV
jgi:hypothetical protein